MDFISREFTFTVNGLALVGIAVFAVISLFTIFYYISHLLSRIRRLETPKYGFLGKPLFTLVGMLVMVAGLGFFSYSFTQQQNFQIQAEKVVTAQLAAKVIESGDTTSLVEISTVPHVDGLPWGGNVSNKFDIYWNLTGAEIKEKFEFSKTLEQPSGYTTFLKRGEYTVKALIVFEGKSYSFSRNLSI